MEPLSEIVPVILGLSIASERLIEIVKKLVPYLATEKKPLDGPAEKRRQAAVVILAVIAGVLTAFFAPESVLPEGWADTASLRLILGLMASGGSSFWNSILDYLKAISDLRQQRVLEAKAGA